MTTTELRTLLNTMRQCPVWRKLMREQRADMAIVMQHIRDELAEAQRLDEAGEGLFAHAIKVRQILHYVEHDRWLHLKSYKPRTVEEGDPEYGEDEGRQNWIRYIASARRDWSYRQAIAFFAETRGYWPKRNWPGMPLHWFDRLKRIDQVTPDRLVPMPDNENDRRTA